MCGILSVFRYDEILCNSVDKIKKRFHKKNKRGPEASSFIYDKDMKYILGFHRLAINGCSDPNSMQPLYLDDVILTCNGEIYNHKELTVFTGSSCSTKSDCEIILHMYKKFGIEYTLKMIDGVFVKEGDE